MNIGVFNTAGLLSGGAGEPAGDPEQAASPLSDPHRFIRRPYRYDLLCYHRVFKLCVSLLFIWGGGDVCVCFKEATLCVRPSTCSHTSVWV